MPTRRNLRAAAPTSAVAPSPLGAAPPPASQQVGARIEIDPAGRKGVLRAGSARVGNFIAFTVSFYNSDTGGALANIPAVTLTLQRVGEDPQSPVAMQAVSGESGSYRATFTPQVGGDWEASFSIASWDVNLVEKFYVLS